MPQACTSREGHERGLDVALPSMCSGLAMHPGGRAELRVASPLARLQARPTRHTDALPCSRSEGGASARAPRTFSECRRYLVQSVGSPARGLTSREQG